MVSSVSYDIPDNLDYETAFNLMCERIGLALNDGHDETESPPGSPSDPNSMHIAASSKRMKTYLGELFYGNVRKVSLFPVSDVFLQPDGRRVLSSNDKDRIKRIKTLFRRCTDGGTTGHFRCFRKMFTSSGPQLELVGDRLFPYYFSKNGEPQLRGVVKKVFHIPGRTDGDSLPAPNVYVLHLRSGGPHLPAYVRGQYVYLGAGSEISLDAATADGTQSVDQAHPLGREISVRPNCSSRESRLLEVALHSILPEAIRLASATGADDLDVDHILHRISTIRNKEDRDHLDELVSDVASAVSKAGDSYGGTRCANRIERVGSSMMQVRFLRLDFCGEDLAITPSVNPDLIKTYRKQVQNLARIGIRDPHVVAESTTLSTASMQAIEAYESVAFTGTSKPCYMGGDGTCTGGVLSETDDLFIALAGTKTHKDGKIYWKDGRGCAVTDVGGGFIHVSEGDPSTLSDVTAMVKGRTVQFGKLITNQ